MAEDEARRLLDDEVAKGHTSGWPYPVIRYLRHEIEAADLLTAATSNFEMTLAQLYLGMDLTLDGHPQAALAHLRWVKL